MTTSTVHPHPTSEIHPDTAPGQVALTVRELERSLAFYTTALGLSILHRNDAEAVLGSHGRALLRLAAQPNAQPWPGHGYAGLYHFALLLPSRLGLAQALGRLVETGTSLEGASDHGVSEALYLRDPDGHGIELYRDRPRDQWPYAGDALQMVSDRLDLHDILGELSRQAPDWEGIQPGTGMGHIHLHTHDLTSALAFYQDGLGFTLMQRYGGAALFLAAGGYHHHVGLNVWAGLNVPPPPADLARLLWYEWVVPGNLAEMAENLQRAGYPVTQIAQGWQTRDPAGLTVRLVLPSM